MVDPSEHNIGVGLGLPGRGQEEGSKAEEDIAEAVRASEEADLEVSTLEFL